MSTTTLATPMGVNHAGVHVRPRLGRLAAVELRKILNTRAGFCCSSRPSRSPPSP